MLPAGANREEINLIAPKVVKTFNNRSCFQVRLNIPNRFLRDSSSRAHPVMYHFAAGGCQRSTYSGFESLATFLEGPRVHDPAASNKPDAVVLPEVFGSSRNSMEFQVGGRGADNAPGG